MDDGGRVIDLTKEQDFKSLHQPRRSAGYNEEEGSAEGED